MVCHREGWAGRACGFTGEERGALERGGGDHEWGRGEERGALWSGEESAGGAREWWRGESGE